MTQLKESDWKNDTTKQMTLIQAINDGMRLLLEEDDRTIILGEDIGKNGGCFVQQKDFRKHLVMSG